MRSQSFPDLKIGSIAQIFIYILAKDVIKLRTERVFTPVYYSPLIQQYPNCFHLSQVFLETSFKLELVRIQLIHAGIHLSENLFK